MNNLLKILNKLTPLLQKKVPLFNQTIQQFSKGKTNAVGITMMSIGIYQLMNNDSSEFGMFMVTTGLGLLTLRDTNFNPDVNKK